LDGNLFSILIGSRKRRRPSIGTKDIKLSLDKGNKLKEGHEGLPREKILCVCGKERKRRRKCEEECLVLMCGEVFMGREYARIKHGRKLCVTSTYSKPLEFWFN